MLLLLFLYSTCNSQDFEIDFRSQQLWTKNIENSTNCTYRILYSALSYIYVNVILFEESPSFQLLQIGNNETQELSVNEKFNDVAGFYKNRKSRFLKVVPSTLPVLIQTLGNSNFSYAISIEVSNLNKCDGDCNQNGFCDVGGCHCDIGYVGDDCSSIANELEEGDEQYQLIPEYSYFSSHLNGQSYANIKISTNSMEGIQFYIKKIDEKENQVAQFFLQGNSAFHIFLKIPDEISFYSQIILVAVLQNFSNETTFLKISTSYDDFKSEMPTSQLFIIIFCSIVGFICVISIIIGFYKYHLNKTKQSTAPQEQKEKYENEQETPLDDKGTVPKLIVVEIMKVNQDDFCIVCQELLVNGKELSQTVCEHTFHKHCIVLWAQDHKECPICRAGLATKNPN